MTNIGREVIWSARKGTIVGEKAGKRGKTVTKIRLESGAEVSVTGHFEFNDVPRFADPEPFADLVADYRRDNARRRRVMGI